MHQSARSFAASRLTFSIGLALAAGAALAQGSPGENVFNSSCPCTAKGVDRFIRVSAD